MEIDQDTPIVPRCPVCLSTLDHPEKLPEKLLSARESYYRHLEERNIQLWEEVQYVRSLDPTTRELELEKKLQAAYGFIADFLS